MKFASCRLKDQPASITFYQNAHSEGALDVGYKNLEVTAKPLYIFGMR